MHPSTCNHFIYYADTHTLLHEQVIGLSFLVYGNEFTLVQFVNFISIYETVDSVNEPHEGYQELKVYAQ